MADKTYDFFIAHAGADREPAEQLYDLLSGSAEVFLDSRSLKFGDDWDRVLPKAQERSRMTLVLLSERTEEAWYEREEIRAAIELARLDGSHRVVPIWLTPRKEIGGTVPYGLRGKHGASVTDDYPLERVAERLLKESAITPPPAPVEISLEALFSRDPTISMPAATALAEQDSAPVDKIVDRITDLNTIQVHALRIALAAFPEQSAAPMVERIMHADVAWAKATFVPACLSVAHQPYCADPLWRGLDARDPDIVRKCIEGLGYVGVAVDHRALLADSGYYYAKYASFVCGAVGRAVALEEPRAFDAAGGLAARAEAFADLVRFIDAHGWKAVGVENAEEAVAEWPPRYADALLGWLSDDLAALRQVAARGLGEMRLRRAMPHLIARAADPGEADSVAAKVLWAIGATGGTGAVDALEKMLDQFGDDAARSPACRWALANCIGDARDAEQFERVARDVLEAEPEVSHRVYRAIGIRGDERFGEELESALQDLSAVDRGAAALALARLGAGGIAERLRQSYEEAIVPFDRVLTALALLTLGDAVPGDPDLTGLCSDLAQDSYIWEPRVRAEIITVLRASPHPRSDAIADAWAPIYRV